MGRVTVKDNTQEFLNRLESLTTQQTGETSLRILHDSQSNCPVQTGRLKGSSYREGQLNEYTVGYSAPYASVVDYRTSFFRDAVLDNEISYKNNMVSAINRAINSLK